ncbi:hypothetical protein BDF14DRAFT_1819543 [Spinellus fusiger]|nr:hypothetical protein BDF14DRAFT_1819543 [Spinellus fusiger]
MLYSFVLSTLSCFVLVNAAPALNSVHYQSTDIWGDQALSADSSPASVIPIKKVDIASLFPNDAKNTQSSLESSHPLTNYLLYPAIMTPESNEWTANDLSVLANDKDIFSSQDQAANQVNVNNIGSRAASRVVSAPALAGDTLENEDTSANKRVFGINDQGSVVPFSLPPSKSRLVVNNPYSFDENA